MEEDLFTKGQISFVTPLDLNTSNESERSNERVF